MLNVKYYPNPALGCADVLIGADAAYYGGQWKRYYAPSGVVCWLDNKTYDTSLDFYIPEHQRLDPNIYEIAGVSLGLVALDCPPSGTLFSNMGIMLRNESAALAYPQLQLPDTPGFIGAIHTAGADYNTQPVAFNKLVYTTVPLASGFYNSPDAPFFVCQRTGLVGLTLRRTLNVDNAALVLALSSYGAGQYTPYMSVDYRPIRRPATITSYAAAGDRVWGRTVPLNIVAMDTEADQQTVTVSGSMFMGGANINRYVPLALDTNTLTLTPDGVSAQLTATLPFRNASIASPSGFNYYRRMKYTNCTSASGVITMTTPTASVTDYDAPLYVNVDLKPNTIYRMGANFTATGGLKPTARIVRGSTVATLEERWLTGNYNPAVRSTYVEFNTATDTSFIPYIRASGTGGTVTISDIILMERDFDPAPVTVHLSVALSDDDGVSAPSGIYIQHDARLARAPVIAASGVSNSVFTTNPIASFTWNAPDTDGVPISGYCYALNTAPTHQIIDASGLFTSNRSLTYAMPWDDRWYLHVAAQTTNGLIGETGHFGYFYNIPAAFNEASGVYCNNKQLAHNTTQWVNYDLCPRFTWSPPQQSSAMLTYHMQIGAAGGITSYTLPDHEIDWSAIPANAAMYFRIQLHDMQGIRYLDRNTTLDATRWDIYDATDKQWRSLTSVLAGYSPVRASLPRVQRADVDLPRYTRVRYTLDASDHIPDDIGFYVTLACGYYSAEQNFIWQAPAQPKSLAFTQSPGVSGIMAHVSITPPTGQYAALNSKFGNAIYRSSEYPRAFSEVYAHDFNTRMALYFNNTTTDQITGASGVYGYTGTGASVSYTDARPQASGCKACRFRGNAYLTYNNACNIGTDSFTVAFWGKFAPLGASRTIMKKLATVGWAIELNSSSNLVASMRDSVSQTDVTTAQNHADGTWGFYVVQFDRTRGPSIWLNGVRIAWVTNPVPIAGSVSTPAPLQIGGSVDVNGVSDFSLDDILVWNRLLTAEEIGWLAGWHYEQVLLGPERSFGVYGLRGDGKAKTVRLYARREFGLPPGIHQFSYNTSIGGAASAYSTPRTVTLATAPLLNYTWSFQDPEQDIPGITANEYKLTTPLKEVATVYMVRMRAYDGFEYSDWTKRYKFRINRKPLPPTNLLVQ